MNLFRKDALEGESIPGHVWRVVGSVIASLSFVLFSLSVTSRVFTRSLQHDDSIYSGVAKNLARGGGYRVCGAEPPFDFAISAGPLLICPVAGLVALFGNKHWVGGLVTAVISLSLYGFIILKVRKSRRIEAILILAALPLFVNEDFQSTRNDLRLWSLLLGETPAALALSLGLIVASGHYGKRGLSSAFLGGLLVGLAVNTKAIMAFSCVGGSLLILTVSLCRRSFAWSAIYVCGVLTPLMTWEIVRLLVLGDVTAWLQLLAQERSCIRYHTSFGLEYWLVAPSKWRLLEQNVTRGMSDLTGHYFGGSGGITLALCAFLILVARAVSSHKSMCRETAAGLALISGSAFHLSWWLACYPLGWVRYLMPSLMIGWVGLSYLIAGRGSRSLKTVSLILIAGLVISRSSQLDRVFTPRVRRDLRLVSLLDTAQFVEGLDQSTFVLYGCGFWMNRDLDYLLPDVCNFNDCLQAPDSIGTTASKRVLLVRSDFWNWEGDEALDSLAARCDQQVMFRSGPFVVSECYDITAVSKRPPVLETGRSAADQ